MNLIHAQAKQILYAKKFPLMRTIIAPSDRVLRDSYISSQMAANLNHMRCDLDVYRLDKGVGANGTIDIPVLLDDLQPE